MEMEVKKQRQRKDDQQQMSLQWIRVWSSPTKFFSLASFVSFCTMGL
jgi:hypothetical protein